MERVWMMLLLLLSFCGGSHEIKHKGIVMTYHYRQTNPDGAVEMDFQFKWTMSKSIVYGLSGWPSHASISETTPSTSVDFSDGCYQNGRIYRVTCTPVGPFYMRITDFSWATNTLNNVITTRASLLVEMRIRSDTGKPNSSPQTTTLPIYRVPYNCPRNIHLLNFDPDGDLVQCRFASKSVDPEECRDCTPPSVLSLSPNCTLSFSGSDHISTQGLYAVQVVMEDFPRTDITLTHSNITLPPDLRRTSDAISKVPVQFLLSMDSFVHSCTPGICVPKFQDPTPKHGAQISVKAGQTVRIPIRAYNSVTNISELVLSGPAGMKEQGSGGQYNLTWTPEKEKDGQSFPVCFSANTIYESNTLSSEVRCVFVNVGNGSLPEELKEAPPEKPQTYMVLSKVGMVTTADLTDETVQAELVKQIMKEMEHRGLPANVSITLVNGTIPKFSRKP